MQLFASPLRRWINPANAYLLLFAESQNSFWLDREASLTEAVTIIGAGRRVTEPLAQIQFQQHTDAELPFSWRPGLVGMLEYEGTEHFIDVDRAMVFDHRNDTVYFVGLFENQDEFKHWKNAAFLRFGLIGGELAAYRLKHEQSNRVIETTLRHSAENYLQLIEKSQRHIAAGDVYLICLTNQISIKHELDPLSVFLNLRETNPAPYAAFLKFGGLSVVCSSPEQFLQISKTGVISTKPIKGTRPRDSDEETDRANAAELLENEKERAENLMIVDLMRNDIGKVSLANSVHVTKLFDIESYATVHQLVSTVQGKLAPGETVATALAAAFPGGSMTGAPKIRAMQIIRDLENGPRGVYSGVIGYLGFDGSADFGMTIRTIVFEGLHATIGVGGGITIDSDPKAELEETKLKAKALLNALKAPNPWG